MHRLPEFDSFFAPACSCSRVPNSTTWTTRKQCTDADSGVRLLPTIVKEIDPQAAYLRALPCKAHASLLQLQPPKFATIDIHRSSTSTRKAPLACVLQTNVAAPHPAVSLTDSFSRASWTIATQLKPLCSSSRLRGASTSRPRAQPSICKTSKAETCTLASLSSKRDKPSQTITRGACRKRLARVCFTNTHSK